MCPPFCRTPYTTPLTDTLVNTEFGFVMKITDSNASESTEKLKSERKSLVKQQILMYNKYLKKVILCGSTLTLR